MFGRVLAQPVVAPALAAVGLFSAAYVIGSNKKEPKPITLDQMDQNEKFKFAAKNGLPLEYFKFDNAEIIFILGGPGSGKGTVCARLVAEAGYYHISAGDELRAARDRQDETADLINSYINDGKIVPVEITVDLLKRAISKIPNHMDGSRKRILIDGFPRNADNLEGWYNENRRNYKKGRFIDGPVIHLDTTEEVMMERCISRSFTEGRSDDNQATIKKRYDTYLKSTKPILAKLEKMNCVFNIDASQPADKVYGDVLKRLECLPVEKRELPLPFKRLLYITSGFKEELLYCIIFYQFRCMDLAIKLKEARYARFEKYGKMNGTTYDLDAMEKETTEYINRVCPDLNFSFETIEGIKNDITRISKDLPPEYYSYIEKVESKEIDFFLTLEEMDFLYSLFLHFKPKE